MSMPSVGTVTSSVPAAREPAPPADRPQEEPVEALLVVDRVDQENARQPPANTARVVSGSSLTSGKIRGLGDFVDKYV